ncbi:hypothetical protein FHT67_003026 [Paenibacillus sp. BK720]|nr:hypothetical protein [Paenibacillus sp. BK720]
MKKIDTSHYRAVGAKSKVMLGAYQTDRHSKLFFSTLCTKSSIFAPGTGNGLVMLHQMQDITRNLAQLGSKVYNILHSVQDRSAYGA